MLLLGAPADQGSFKSLAIPDGYPIADALPIIVQVWGDPLTPPLWVASDHQAMATAAAGEFGDVPIRPLADVYEDEPTT